MGGGGSSTTVQKADPWSGAQEDILASLEGARDLYNADPLGQSLIAQRDPLTLGAEQGMIGRVLSGQATQGAQAGQQAISGILSRGAYGGTDALMDNISTNVMPRVDAAFSGAGRTGSGLHQDTAVRAMTEASAPALAGLYQNETENQIRASALAPQVDQAAMNDLGILSGIGDTRRMEAQRQIDAPYAALDRYFNYAVGAGGLGGQQSSTSPGGGIGSAISGGLGGALGGYALAPALGVAGPVGIAAGAGLGILGGLFS